MIDPKLILLNEESEEESLPLTPENIPIDTSTLSDEILFHYPSPIETPELKLETPEFLEQTPKLTIETPKLEDIPSLSLSLPQEKLESINQTLKLANIVDKVKNRFDDFVNYLKQENFSEEVIQTLTEIKDNLNWFSPVFLFPEKDRPYIFALFTSALSENKELLPLLKEYISKNYPNLEEADLTPVQKKLFTNILNDEYTQLSFKDVLNMGFSGILEMGATAASALLSPIVSLPLTLTLSSLTTSSLQDIYNEYFNLAREFLEIYGKDEEIIKKIERGETPKELEEFLRERVPSSFTYEFNILAEEKPQDLPTNTLDVFLTKQAIKTILSGNVDPRIDFSYNVYAMIGEAAGVVLSPSRKIRSVVDFLKHFTEREIANITVQSITQKVSDWLSSQGVNDLSLSALSLATGVTTSAVYTRTIGKELSKALYKLYEAKEVVNRYNLTPEEDFLIPKEFGNLVKEIKDETLNIIKSTTQNDLTVDEQAVLNKLKLGIFDPPKASTEELLSLFEKIATPENLSQVPPHLKNIITFLSQATQKTKEATETFQTLFSQTLTNLKTSIEETKEKAADLINSIKNKNPELFTLFEKSIKTGKLTPLLRELDSSASELSLEELGFIRGIIENHPKNVFKRLRDSLKTVFSADSEIVKKFEDIYEKTLTEFKTGDWFEVYFSPKVFEGLKSVQEIFTNETRELINSLYFLATRDVTALNPEKYLAELFKSTDLNELNFKIIFPKLTSYLKNVIENVSTWNFLRDLDPETLKKVPSEVFNSLKRILDNLKPSTKRPIKDIATSAVNSTLSTLKNLEKTLNQLNLEKLLEDTILKENITPLKEQLAIFFNLTDINGEKILENPIIYPTFLKNILTEITKDERNPLFSEILTLTFHKDPVEFMRLVNLKTSYPTFKDVISSNLKKQRAQVSAEDLLITHLYEVLPQNWKDALVKADPESIIPQLTPALGKLAELKYELFDLTEFFNTFPLANISKLTPETLSDLSSVVSNLKSRLLGMIDIIKNIKTDYYKTTQEELSSRIKGLEKAIESKNLDKIYQAFDSLKTTLAILRGKIDALAPTTSLHDLAEILRDAFTFDFVKSKIPPSIYRNFLSSMHFTPTKIKQIILNVLRIRREYNNLLSTYDAQYPKVIQTLSEVFTKELDPTTMKNLFEDIGKTGSVGRSEKVSSTWDIYIKRLLNEVETIYSLKDFPEFDQLLKDAALLPIEEFLSKHYKNFDDAIKFKILLNNFLGMWIFRATENPNGFAYKALPDEAKVFVDNLRMILNKSYAALLSRGLIPADVSYENYVRYFYETFNLETKKSLINNRIFAKTLFEESYNYILAYKELAENLPTETLEDWEPPPLPLLPTLINHALVQNKLPPLFEIQYLSPINIKVKVTPLDTYYANMQTLNSTLNAVNKLLSEMLHPEDLISHLTKYISNTKRKIGPQLANAQILIPRENLDFSLQKLYLLNLNPVAATISGVSKTINLIAQYDIFKALNQEYKILVSKEFAQKFPFLYTPFETTTIFSKLPEEVKSLFKTFVPQGNIYLHKDAFEVIKDVIQFTHSFPNALENILSLIRTLHLPFKLAHVLFNSAVMVRNIIGNMVAASLGADCSYVNGMKALWSGIKSILSKDKYYQELTSSGYIRNVAAFFQEIPSYRLEGKTSTQKAVNFIINTFDLWSKGKVINFLSFLNALFDDAVRVGLYKYYLENGVYKNGERVKLSKQDYLERARMYSFDYLDIPKGITVLRDTIMPFASFPYLSLKMAINSFKERPIKTAMFFLTPIILAELLEKKGYSLKWENLSILGDTVGSFDLINLPIGLGRSILASPLTSILAFTVMGKDVWSGKQYFDRNKLIYGLKSEKHEELKNFLTGLSNLLTSLYLPDIYRDLIYTSVYFLSNLDVNTLDAFLNPTIMLKRVLGLQRPEYHDPILLRILSYAGININKIDYDQLRLEILGNIKKKMGEIRSKEISLKMLSQGKTMLPLITSTHELSKYITKSIDTIQRNVDEIQELISYLENEETLRDFLHLAEPSWVKLFRSVIRRTLDLGDYHNRLNELFRRLKLQ